MADWTQIPDATFDTDRPILGSTHLAIVRNFEAMAEGADGAPRLYGKAAVPISQISELEVISINASDDFNLRFAAGDLDLNLVGDFSNVNTNDFDFVSAGTVTIRAVSGSARFKARQTSRSSPNLPAGETEVRLLKNGNVVNSFTLSTPSGADTSENRSIDVSVSPGDVFEWQARRADGGSRAILENFAITASDRYERIGIPIKASDV